ncbi:hypothetical protein RFI_12338, partial [Reticulomyxa filosa]
MPKQKQRQTQAQVQVETPSTKWKHRRAIQRLKCHQITITVLTKACKKQNQKKQNKIKVRKQLSIVKAEKQKMVGRRTKPVADVAQANRVDTIDIEAIGEVVENDNYQNHPHSKTVRDGGGVKIEPGVKVKPKAEAGVGVETKVKVGVAVEVDTTVAVVDITRTMTTATIMIIT